MLCGSALTFAERLRHVPGHLVLDLAELCPGNGSSEEANVRTYRMPMACGTCRDAVFTDIVGAITRFCPTVAKACRSRAREASLARPCR
jgi:hypothetical protein